MYMGWFNAISGGNIVREAINAESCRPTEPESLSCKSYTLSVRPCNRLGRY